MQEIIQSQEKERLFMKNKLTKVAVTMVAGAVLFVGTAFAAEEVTLGKNMTGQGLGQGSTKYFISDFLMMDPFKLRAERSAGLSMVAIAEKQGVSGDALIDAVVEFRSNNLGETCVVEDVRAKVTNNLTQAPTPKANANPIRMQMGERAGEQIGGQMRGQARGWQR